jgi:hypothetical protein
MIMLININRPFYGAHEDNSMLFSEAALVYANYGFLKTRFAPILIPPANLNVSKLDSYYLNHPILLPVSLAFIYKILPFANWSTRLLPIIFTLLSIGGFFYLILHISGYRVAVVSSIILILTPLFIYYGQMVCHEALIFFFFIVLTFLYIKYQNNNSNAHLAIFGFLLFLMNMVDWSGYYFGFTLIITEFVRYKKITQLVKTILLVAAISALITLSHFYLVQGSLKFLVDVFITRTINTGTHYTIYDWFVRMIKNLDNGFSSFIVFLFLISLFFFARRKKYLSYKEKIFLFISLLFPSFHLLIFRSNAYMHDYWLFYYAAGISFCVAKFFLIIINHYIKSFNTVRKNIRFAVITIFIITFVYFTRLGIRKYYKYTEVNYYIGWEQVSLLNQYAQKNNIDKFVIYSPDGAAFTFSYYLKYPSEYRDFDTSEIRNGSKNEQDISHVLLAGTVAYARAVKTLCNELKCTTLLERKESFLGVV